MDDEADTREIASAILGRSQRRSGNCGKRLTGHRPYRSGEPDVLVADIGMPGEDGYDLISKVRARFSDKRGQIPAIALTAFARPQDRLKVLSAGYQMHVPKPSRTDRAYDLSCEPYQQTREIMMLRAFVKSRPNGNASR